MNTISPLDNRYSQKIEDVVSLFSDYSWNQYKWTVELEYLHFFLLKIDRSGQKWGIVYNTEIYREICDEERKTNHDVQALINVIKSKIPREFGKWVHFGLTSQDINSPAMMLMYKKYVNTCLLTDVDVLISKVDGIVEECGDIDILSFTHGQPATPIKVRNIFNVYSNKIHNIKNDISQYKWSTKIGGSNGNLTSLGIVFPDINWSTEMDNFVKILGLERNQHTTQIDDYSNYFKLFQILERLCYILINICQDIWYYCSKKYLLLKKVEGEVGSSAMPHKINPIQFENAEGNLKLAANMLHTIGSNIMTCRLQRDLTDSTLLRNVGVAFGHLSLSARNMVRGMDRISFNREVIKADLMDNNCTKMETIQLLFRKWDIQDGYDVCKEFIRGKTQFQNNAFMQYLEQRQIFLDATQKNIISQI